MAPSTRKSSFAFTYKINVVANDVANVTEDHYTVVFQTVALKGGIVNHYVYEKDPKGLLHIHGVAELPKSIKYTSLAIKGYSSKWKEIYNLAGWLDYMTKDHKLRESVAFECYVKTRSEDSDAESEHERAPKFSLFKPK